MAYRQALLMAGDPLYRRAREAQGDPIFPFIAAAARRFAPKILRAGGRLVSRLRGGRAGRLARVGAATVGAGAGFALGERIVTGGRAGRDELGAFKRRRMQVTNARALRRAIRRVSGFGKIVKRMKSAIGRAATAVGVRRGMQKRGRAPAPTVRVVKA